MKKLLILLVLLLCAVPAVAQESQMEENAATLAQELPSIISNEAYVEINAGFLMEDIRSMIGEYSGYTWEHPLYDVYLSADMEAWEAELTAQGHHVTENVRGYMRQAAPALIANRMLGVAGVEDAIAINVMQCARWYIDPAQPDGTLVFLRFFADGSPLVYLMEAQAGAVMMSVFVPLNTGELGCCKNAQEVQTWLDANAMVEVFTATDEPVLMPYVQGSLNGSTMAERALSLVPQLQALMGDEEYARLVTQDEDVMLILEHWSEGDYARPRLMVQAELDLATHGVQLWGVNSAYVCADRESPAARTLHQRIAGTAGLYLQTNDLSKVMEIMEASQVAVVAAMYADPQQPDGAGLYIMLYDVGNAVGVSWCAENGVVSLSASCLSLDGLADCQTVAELSMWMFRHGLSVELNEVNTD